ncbi:MAG TPA: hypothetical protein VL832_05960 [Puia sp.]|jgi:hypothetical protein|nr:hypothetical protein [Puia sp.]
MTILLTGLLAGFLDGAAATLLYLARGNKKPGPLFQYIASAVFGKAAFAGGGFMVLMGLCFHFLIALAVVSFYFVLYPHIPWLGTTPLAGAAIYGLLVWVIMNLVVLPLSRAAPRPFSWVFALINMLILMVAIGLPTAYLARHYFQG